MPGLEGLWLQWVTLGNASFRVSDSTDKPLVGARLTLSAAQRTTSEWVTSEAGFVLAQGLAWGDRVEVEVSLPGYAAVRHSVLVEPGFPLWPHIEIRLLKLPYLRGVVLGEDGFPIGGSSVLLTSPNQQLELRTSKDGIFCFEDIEANAFLDLTVKARGFATGYRQVPPLLPDAEADLGEIGLASERRCEGVVRSPGGQGIAAAKIALVSADQLKEENLEITPFPPPTEIADQEGRFRLAGLPRGNRLALLVWSEGYLPALEPLAKAESFEIVLQPATYIRGTVVDRDGSPTPAVVQLRVAQAALTADTDDRGHFVLGPLRPGLRRIQAVDSLLQLAGGTEIDVPSAGIDNLVLTLEPSLTLEGTVLGPDFQPIPGATVVLEYPGIDSRHQTTLADGTFIFEELSAGKVNVRAGHSQLGSVERVLELSPSVVQLTLELPPQQASHLSVEAQDGFGPLEGVEVLATDQGFRQRTFKMSTDMQGVASFPELSAGRYLLDFRRIGYLPQRLEVTLEPGAERRVQVRLDAEQLVEGRIRSIAHAELAQLAAFVIHESRSKEGQVVLDRSDGSFVLKGLSPGVWELHLRLPPYFRSLKRQVVIDSEGGHFDSFIDVDWSETDP